MLRMMLIRKNKISLKEIQSKTYTELYNLGTVDDGTMVFVTPFNRPAYISGGIWYMMTGTSLTLP